MSEKRLKVLQVLEATSGGTLKHLMYIATRLDKSKFDVSVACSSLRNPKLQHDMDVLCDFGIDVHVIQMDRRISISKDCRAFLQLLRLMRRNRYDIVHTHSSKAGFLGRFAARLAGTPVILYSPHAFYFYRGILGESAFYLALERMAGLVTDAVVTVSYGEGSIARRYRVCGEPKIVTIENGVDLAEFACEYDADSKKKELGVPTHVPLVGMVGRICEQKGYRYFIRAARDVLLEKPETVFLLVGCGGDQDDAAGMIRRYGIGEKVIMTGLREDLPDLYSIFDVVVLPSLWEGMPYVLLEAMAMEVPVIASDIPGVHEVIDDSRTGIFFPPGDVAALARKIVELLSSADERVRIGAEARRTVAGKYTVDDKIRRLEGLYETLFDRAPSRFHQPGKTL